MGIGEHEERHQRTKSLHPAKIEFHATVKQYGAWYRAGARTSVHPTDSVAKGCCGKAVDRLHRDAIVRQKRMLLALRDENCAACR